MKVGIVKACLTPVCKILSNVKILTSINSLNVGNLIVHTEYRFDQNRFKYRNLITKFSFITRLNIKDSKRFTIMPWREYLDILLTCWAHHGTSFFVSFLSISFLMKKVRKWISNHLIFQMNMKSSNNAFMKKDLRFYWIMIIDI